MTIVAREPEAGICITAIAADSDRRMSAGTATEALIVADGRGLGIEMRALIDRLRVEIIPTTATSADQVAEAYRQWGKGNHPTKLNFGDCFAYALARELDCPLLFIGNDFNRTDVKRA